jgi:hypothetical protein
MARLFLLFENIFEKPAEHAPIALQTTPSPPAPIRNPRQTPLWDETVSSPTWGANPFDPFGDLIPHTPIRKALPVVTPTFTPTAAKSPAIPHKNE